MGDFEAIGEVVSGAALASVVEPATGKIAKGHTRETNCLNCGTPLVGSYCHTCGQHGHVHRTIMAFSQDFLNGTLNFEGKIFKTLPLLAWRPGDLTRRYIDGQRARFVSPFALFLFSVFLLFAAIQMVGGSTGLEKVSVGNNLYHSTDEAIGGVTARLAVLNAKRARADAEGKADIDKQIAEQNQALSTLQRFKKEGVTNAILADKKSTDDLETDIPLLQDAIARAKANPQLAIYKLQDAASKYAWLLIPISVPFMWLLFPFSPRFKPYDHIVFVTYSLSFMMLLAVVITGWSKTGIRGAAVAAVFIPPIHMYRQLKGTYGLKRFGTLWRLTLLLAFALTALILFAVAVVLLGISD
jgi:uncharacterized small protein (DUF1192 family)